MRTLAATAEYRASGSGRLRQLFSGLVLIVTAMFMIGAASASAASLQVETTGTDSPTCGPIATPCLTISHAVNLAAPGDTVNVGGGTFVETPNGVQINKPLTLRGTADGSDRTTISGGLSTTATSRGTIGVTAAGAVTVRNFNVVSFSSLGTPNVGTANKLGLYARPPASGATPIYNFHQLDLDGSGGGPRQWYLLLEPGQQQRRDPVPRQLDLRPGQHRNADRELDAADNAAEQPDPWGDQQRRPIGKPSWASLELGRRSS